MTTTTTTEYVTIDGLKLSVKIAGTGRPFLFLHGLCGDALQPLELFPDDAGWQCHALESRGHGGSDIGDMKELSIRRLTEDATAYLESLDCGPAVIGGVSMGAAIALRLTADRPELAAGLVPGTYVFTVTPELLEGGASTTRLVVIALALAVGLLAMSWLRVGGSGEQGAGSGE